MKIRDKLSRRNRDKRVAKHAIDNDQELVLCYRVLVEKPVRVGGRRGWDITLRFGKVVVNTLKSAIKDITGRECFDTYRRCLDIDRASFPASKLKLPV